MAAWETLATLEAKNGEYQIGRQVGLGAWVPSGVEVVQQDVTQTGVDRLI